MGFNLIRSLRAAAAKVNVLSRSWPPQHESYDRMLEGITYFKGDIRDAVVVEEAVANCDLIFHLAGKSGPTASNASPLEDLDVNGRGMLTLLEACCRVRPGAKIVFPSSRLVYSASADLPVSEAAPTAPLSIYGIHKLAGEQYLLLYQRLHGLKVTILRISNPYGPFQRPEQSQYGIVNWFIHEAMHGRPLPVYGNGAQLRDYVHIDDVVDAMMTAGVAPQADGRIFNVGSGLGVSFLEMAELIIRKAGRGSIKHLDWPAGAAAVETGDFVADTSLIAERLRWQATIRFESGIDDVVGQQRTFESA